MHTKLCVVGAFGAALALTGAAGAAAARDPKIMKLAKAALACPFEDQSFSEECAGFKAWRDNEELFADGKGDETIFSMYGDADVKMRVLASEKGMSDSEKFFDDKAHATKLFELAAKETAIGPARSFADYVKHLDAEKRGFAKELRALVKHPVKQFRENLTSVIVYSQSAAALDVIRTLLADPERDVRRSAISALSAGGMTPGVEPVCALLSKQFERTDDLIGDALWSGSSSKCTGIDKQVMTQLSKRTADPSKITNAVGIGYSLAAEGVCRRSKDAELKKQGFAVGKRLTDAKVTDANTRNAGLGVLADCDPAQARAALTALSKDKDSFVAKQAAAKLGALSK